MQYIRTKYEILSNSRPVIEDEDCVLTDQRGWIKKHSVVKQSDDIKDLFDAYVVIDIREDVVTQIINSLQKAKNQKGIYEEIYGAIWIKGDKGEPILKSVAKLNNKGELELL